MNKLILLMLALSSFSLFAQESVDITENDEPIVIDESIDKKEDEFVPPPAPEPAPVAAKAPPQATKAELDDDEDDAYYIRKSRWVATYGFENMKYPTVFNFQGTKKSFKDSEKELWGGRIGFGGELYLGAGFVTRSMVEGYYVGTLFERILNGGKEAADIKFAYTKQTGQVLGADISQSLGWMFNFKTKNPFMDTWSHLTVEPFVDVGMGKAYAYNRLTYKYDLAPASPNEAYKLKVRDDLLNSRVGAGINMTSKQGFFLTLKVTVNRYDITQRKSQGFTQPAGQTATPINTTDKNAKMDPVTVYHLGGGYKF